MLTCSLCDQSYLHSPYSLSTSQSMLCSLYPLPHSTVTTAFTLALFFTSQPIQLHSKYSLAHFKKLHLPSPPLNSQSKLHWTISVFTRQLELHTYSPAFTKLYSPSPLVHCTINQRFKLKRVTFIQREKSLPKIHLSDEHWKRLLNFITCSISFHAYFAGWIQLFGWKQTGSSQCLLRIDDKRWIQWQRCVEALWVRIWGGWGGRE